MKIKKISIIILLLVASIKLIAVVDVTIADSTISKYAGWDKSGNPLEYVHQFIIPIEKDGVNLNTIIEFTVSGANSNWGLRILNKSDNSIFANYTFTGTIDTFEFNATNALSTLYVFEFYNRNNNAIIQVHYGNTTKPFNYYFVTERSKTGTFANSPTNFKYKLNWVDYWLNLHPNPAQFKASAEQALNFNWDKQITEWKLCEGLANNEPIDDNTLNPEFDLNLDGYNQKGFPYRGCAASNAMRAVTDRNISYDYYTYQNDTANKYTNELSQLHSTIAHEFFHNVQYSHNQMHYTPDDQMKWANEGQATFMKTIIMQAFNAPNEEFLANRYYSGRTKEILESFLNYNIPASTGLYFTDLTEDISPYRWAVIWRYLFDTYFQNNGQLPPTKDGLKIIMETVKHVTNLTTIQANMDIVLSAGHGTYSTFNGLLKNFMEDFYFCNNPAISNYIDVNHNNFYSGIRNSTTSKIDTIKYLLTHGNGFGLFYEEYTFDGSILNLNTYTSFDPPPYYTSARKQKLNIALDNPFQMQSREIFFTNPTNGIKITISNDINGDGNNTYVKAYIVDNQGAISDSVSTNLTGTASHVFDFQIANANSKLIMLFLRTDQTAAGQVRTGDLEIFLAPTCPGTGANFKMNDKILNIGSGTTFTNLSCSNNTSWHWVFEGGIPAAMDGEGPHQVLYPTAGTFNASLTVSDGTVSDTKTQQITVNANQASNAEIDFTYNPEENKLTAQALPGVVSWKWSLTNENILGTDPIINPHLPLVMTSYSITLTVTFGDNSTKSKTQKIYFCGYPFTK